MTNAKKRISIKDLATRAGVSPPTVSRALQGRGRVSNHTRQRIVQLAEELGYTPSLVARGLVTQRSYCVGLVVTTFADPFHSDIAQGIEEAARAHNYSIFLASTQLDPVAEGVDPAREVEVVRCFQARRVDGIIVSSSRVGNRYADLLQETGIPIVLINAHVEGDNLHSIRHDDYAGGCALMNHLLARGYRRIAYLGNERGIATNFLRRRAWAETLQAAGLAPTLAVEGPNGRFQGGLVGAEDVLRQAHALWGAPPDALYCYNDTMAIGALAVLRRHHLRAPEDVALSGFDDIDYAAFMEPPLTTWRQPRRAMGAQAMRLLLALMEQTPGEPLPKQTIMPGELVVRGST
jgi:DNA-binding LacI/PurR family transcriptional regulator